MNKTITYTIIGIIAVAGIVWLIFKGGAGMVKNSSTSDNGTSQAGGQSFKDLAMSRTSQTCTFTTTMNEVSSVGTVYVAGGKMRGDFDVTPIQGASYDLATGTHMILDQGYIYSWSDAMPTMGVKILVNANTEGEAASKGFDANQKVDFNCSPWTLDTTKFLLPAGVTFTDMNNVALPPGVSGSDTIYNK